MQAKHKSSSSRFMKIFQALQKKLKDVYNIEKMLAVRNKCLAQFSQTWNYYEGVLYCSYFVF